MILNEKQNQKLNELAKVYSQPENMPAYIECDTEEVEKYLVKFGIDFALSLNENSEN